MALEQLLADLTAAIRENTAAQTGAVTEKKPRKNAATADQATSAVSTASQVVTGPASAAPAAATGPSLKDVADKFMEVAAKDRATAVAIIGKFGAAKLSEVKPGNLADVLALCVAALNPAGAATPASSLI